MRQAPCWCQAVQCCHVSSLRSIALHQALQVKGDRDDLQACQLPGLRRCAQLLQPGQEGAVRVVQKPRKRAWRAHHQLCDVHPPP